jgi:CRISPR-associated endonuclease/helicase Cas3
MNRSFAHLLAKSTATPNEPRTHERLDGHILDVLTAARTLLHAVGHQLLGSFALPSRWFAVLESAVARGALLHDLGKANDQFQRMVRAERAKTIQQALRHEWISLDILLQCPDLDNRLFPTTDAHSNEQKHFDDKLIRHAAICAVVGHHLRPADVRDGSGQARIQVLAGHPDVDRLLRRAGSVLHSNNSMTRPFVTPPLVTPPPIVSDYEIDLTDNPCQRINSWRLEADRWWRELPPEPKRAVAIIKALVIAADLAASALPRRGIDPVTWIQSVLARTCTEAELTGLATRSLAGRPRRPFQDKVAASPADVTLVSAGCGSGKTTAAYLWAARRANGRKLFFCYPTTGTATEGYTGYVAQDDIPSTLIHSRAAADLQDILSTPEDDDRQLRIEALAGWDVPLVVCTADRVLGLVQNNKAGLFAIPAIGKGAFIFDEVHAYDDRMFGALLRFIGAFRGAPLLLMTASLQAHRLDGLRRLCAQSGHTFTAVEGPADLEQIPRYRLARVRTEAVAWSEVIGALENGKRVLWVVNTVDRAVGLYREVRNRGDWPVVAYHSRFRYADRVRKHKGVVNAFKGDRGAFLAITTQVCEVSLDLSADLLVTDLAPVPALIQRLGRLNRFVTPEAPGKPRSALVLTPPHPAPYEQSDFNLARQWLDRLSDQLSSRALSQADLAVAWSDLTSADQCEAGGSAWLDGGPVSEQWPLREPGVTIPVVRGEDAARARCSRIEAIRSTIPMLLGPVAREWPTWPRLGVARVTPAGRVAYSEDWGAAWTR